MANSTLWKRIGNPYRNIELAFYSYRRSIKVTLLPENLFYFPLDISPNCSLTQRIINDAFEEVEKSFFLKLQMW